MKVPAAKWKYAVEDAVGIESLNNITTVIPESETTVTPQKIIFIKS